MKLSSNVSSDKQWVERLAAGDVAALGEIYNRYKDAVYRFALAFSGARDLAADVTQETFMQLALRPQGFDPAQGALGGYLAGIARNLARRAMGEALRYDGEGYDESDGDGVAPVTDAEVQTPLSRILQDEAAERVRLAVRRLPPHYREVVVLVELQEMSYAATAQILAIEVGTVRSRLSRGRALLVEWLREYAQAGASAGEKAA